MEPLRERQGGFQKQSRAWEAPAAPTHRFARMERRGAVIPLLPNNMVVHFSCARSSPSLPHGAALVPQQELEPKPLCPPGLCEHLEILQSFWERLWEKAGKQGLYLMPVFSITIRTTSYLLHFHWIQTRIMFWHLQVNPHQPCKAKKKAEVTWGTSGDMPNHDLGLKESLKELQISSCPLAHALAVWGSQQKYPRKPLNALLVTAHYFSSNFSLAQFIKSRWLIPHDVTQF